MSLNNKGHYLSPIDLDNDIILDNEYNSVN